MAFNAKDFIIDRVRRVTEVNLETGLVNWTLTNIQSPSVEFTGEVREKLDALGAPLARFDGAKGVNFTGEGSVLSAPLMASQLGTTVQVASEEVKISGKTFEVVKVENGTATLKYTPKTAPAYVYVLTADKNIDTYMPIGAGESDASITENVVTMPEGFEGGSIGVLYEYETSEAIKVVDGSENNAEAAEYIVDILAADICNPSIKRAGSLVFPKAKIDNNFTIDLTTEGTHPFSFSALKDYCSDEAELCYWLFHE